MVTFLSRKKSDKPRPRVPASPHPRVPAILAFDCKSVFTAGADYGVFPFSFGQAKGCAARGAFAVDVSFSILEFIFSQTEKSAESSVFLAPFFDIARKHTVEDSNCKGNGYQPNAEVVPH